jgi:hypothetical protein
MSHKIAAGINLQGYTLFSTRKYKKSPKCWLILYPSLKMKTEFILEQGAEEYVWTLEEC